MTAGSQDGFGQDGFESGGPQPQQTGLPPQPTPSPQQLQQPQPEQLAPFPPAAPPAPPDRWRTAAVAVLNLSGLGLGFVLIRRRRAALLCWAATALLLLIALPATPDGVPVAIIILYLLTLAIAAVRGAMLAHLTPTPPLRRPHVALAVAVALLAVPACGTILFDNARQEAAQQVLLGRLAQADAAVANAEAQPAATGTPLGSAYDAAMNTYLDLLDNHRTSRAAKQVPARLTAFYQHLAAPYGSGDYCGAIEPLTYLHSLPFGGTGTAGLANLRTFADDRLQTSLYQCGVAALGVAKDTTAQQNLNTLLSGFPASPQAAKVEPAVAAAIGTAAKGLTGTDPCSATTTLTSLSTQVNALTSAVPSIADALKKDAATDSNAIESGTYDCAVWQYKAGKFSEAQTAMDSFATTYPDDPNKALAQKYSIAAQIAQEESDAGKVTPNLTTGGSVTLVISNDSPDPMQILYTGPATGTISIGACAACKSYASSADGQANACGNQSTTYPKTTVTVPPGTLYFLQKSSGIGVQSYAHSEQYEADSVYDVCAFETSIFGNFGLAPAA